ncbi:hypothetical protein RRF57_008055 [Xylaria bambusicola]|uniref:Uncharacterized protein n=1 Tax=Xylaria bambusicola TaxID=326684 RepID=A0AAN7UT33_9PEZI
MKTAKSLDKVSTSFIIVDSCVTDKMKVFIYQFVFASSFFLSLSEAHGDHGTCKAFPGTTAVSVLLYGQPEFYVLNMRLINSFDMRMGLFWDQ